MKRIKIGLVGLVFLFCLFFIQTFNQVLAAEVEDCTPGARFCIGSMRYVCNSSGTAWLTYNCPNGCSGGYCIVVKESCCNLFLDSGCYSSLSSSQMCKAGSYVSESAWVDYGYPDLGESSWRWGCTADTLNCESEDCATGYCVSTCNSGACGGSNNTSVCSWSNLSSFCNSTYGSVATDSVGSDGLFNWTCYGQAAKEAVCSPSGANAFCTATKITSVAKVDGTCSGINGTVVQTPPTSGQLCSLGSPSGFSGTVNYTWSCLGTDGVCPTSTGGDSSCWATLDTKPTISSVVLKNATGSVMSADANGRNNICETGFNDNKTSVWTITATDAQGVADIKTIDFRFYSVARTYDFNEVTNPSGGVATFTADTGSFDPGTYSVQYLLTDQHSPDPGTTGWVTARTFKVWDCQVDIVNGTIYNNSANQPCSSLNDSGFTTLIPPFPPANPSTQRFDLGYGPKTTGDIKRNMDVNSPYFNSPDTLTWQNSYFLDYINTQNEQFLGQFTTMKIGNSCVNYSDYLIPSSHVSAYDDNPTLNIKYSAIMDQEAWYRVINGGIFSKTNITNYVPVTCTVNCKTALSGLIWSGDVNLSESDVGATFTAVLKRPVSYGYEALKYDIYGGKEVGTTISTESIVLWSGIKDNPTTNKGVIFIEGDLTIDTNMVPSEPTLLVVKGNIIIDEAVTQVTGMLFADNTIQASGKSNSQLKITGSLYGKKGVILNRTFTIKRTNNTTPAIEITYDPNLVFNLDPKLWYIYDNWRLE